MEIGCLSQLLLHILYLSHASSLALRRMVSGGLFLFSYCFTDIFVCMETGVRNWTSAVRSDKAFRLMENAPPSLVAQPAALLVVHSIIKSWVELAAWPLAKALVAWRAHQELAPTYSQWRDREEIRLLRRVRLLICSLLLKMARTKRLVTSSGRKKVTLSTRCTTKRSRWTKTRFLSS